MPTQIQTQASPAVMGIVPQFRTVGELLGGQFEIDDYQREYKWGQEHIVELLNDLHGKFRRSYKGGDTDDVANYEGYFLGSIIVHKRNNKSVLIDGQQRVTSLTLLLIYLYHAAKKRNNRKATERVAGLIYSAPLGKENFNLDIPERREVIDALYRDEGKNFSADGKDESVQNIIRCYHDIAEYGDTSDSDSDAGNGELLDDNTGFAAFLGDALFHFIYWLITKVGMIEINTSREDDAYTIFETMNDRGEPLSPVDMMKANLLSSITDDKLREQCNQIWKGHIGNLRAMSESRGESEDSKGIKAWLRAQYADSIRVRSIGAEDRDWELIGSRFHRWVRDNRAQTVDKHGGSDKFILNQFDFFASAHKRILNACRNYEPGLEPVYYNNHNKFTWQNTVLLAPLSAGDDNDTVRRKIAITAAFLDIWVMRRVTNRIHVGFSNVSYAMYLLCRKIRNKSPRDLAEILKAELGGRDTPTFEGSGDRNGIDGLFLSQFSRRYIYYLLARVAAFIERGTGKQDPFVALVSRDVKNSCDIEHIWPDNYEWENNGFESRDDFNAYRDHVGGLLLLPAKENRGLGDAPFEKKVKTYLKHNMWAATLSKDFATNNPGLAQFAEEHSLRFRGYDAFTTKAHDERTQLLLELMQVIWSPDRLDDYL